MTNENKTPGEHRLLGIIEKMQQAIKTAEELRRGFVEGKAAEDERNAPVVFPPGTEAPRRESPEDRPVYKD